MSEQVIFGNTFFLSSYPGLPLAASGPTQNQQPTLSINEQIHTNKKYL